MYTEELDMSSLFTRKNVRKKIKELLYLIMNGGISSLHEAVLKDSSVSHCGSQPLWVWMCIIDLVYH